MMGKIFSMKKNTYPEQSLRYTQQRIFLQLIIRKTQKAIEFWNMQKVLW